MRRPLTTLLIAASCVLLAPLPAGATTHSAAQPTGGCAGDTVSASMSSAEASGAKWSVTGACVDARDYFVGVYQDRHPFAIGISNVTYDDGHTGRLAFLSVRIDPAQTVTVLGMEDPRTGELRFAGTVRQAAIGETGATAAGAGITFPPLGAATVELDFSDTAAQWPDWASSATAPTTTTTLPTPDDATQDAASLGAVPETSIPSVSSIPPIDGVPSVDTIPTVPGVGLTTTTLAPIG